MKEKKAFPPGRRRKEGAKVEPKVLLHHQGRHSVRRKDQW
jgi:hypothetical protein